MNTIIIYSMYSLHNNLLNLINNIIIYSVCCLPKAIVKISWCKIIYYETTIASIAFYIILKLDKIKNINGRIVTFINFIEGCLLLLGQKYITLQISGYFTSLSSKLIEDKDLEGVLIDISRRNFDKPILQTSKTAYFASSLQTGYELLHGSNSVVGDSSGYSIVISFAYASNLFVRAIMHNILSKLSRCIVSLPYLIGLELTIVTLHVLEPSTFG